MAAAQQCLALFKKPTLEPPHIVKIFYWRSREINEIVYDNNISLIRHVVVKIATINLCPYIFHTNIVHCWTLLVQCIMQFCGVYNSVTKRKGLYTNRFNPDLSHYLVRYRWSSASKIAILIHVLGNVRCNRFSAKMLIYYSDRHYENRTFWQRATKHRMIILFLYQNLGRSAWL